MKKRNITITVKFRCGVCGDRVDRERAVSEEADCLSCGVYWKDMNIEQKDFVGPFATTMDVTLLPNEMS